MIENNTIALTYEAVTFGVDEKMNRLEPASTAPLVSLLAGVVLSLSAASGAGAAEAWYPIEVDVWTPAFNTDLKRRTGTYVALEKAARPWRLCASIPHLKDPYWGAVNYALIDEAKRLGVGLRLVEAGGYGHLDVQRKQIVECMASGADGLIVSAISADGLNDLAERYTGEGKAVIDMINGMASSRITARAGVDFFDTGLAAGNYIRRLHGGDTGPARVAWFPGPEGATWVDQGDRGFRKALEGSPIRIVAGARGDTGRATQGKLVEAALDAHPDIEYIAGTTVTADAAVEILRRRGLTGKIKVLAYYYGPGVHRGIRRGNVVAAPTDMQAIQARISVDLAVRALERKPFLRHVGPKVMVVDRNNIKAFDATTSLPPRGFRPIFSVNDWGN